jgi:hypothetical protein
MTVHRLKTYASFQGYVYEYCFAGKHTAPAGNGSEYVFDVTSDRKTTYSVVVLLPAHVVAEWAVAHGRDLSTSEQYAGVKMRLFRAFDELEDMQQSGLHLGVDLLSFEESLATLGIA